MKREKLAFGNGEAMIKVEKGIKMPPSVGGRGNSKYPWKELKVSDSFFVPNVTTPQMGSQTHHAGRVYGHKYSCRSENGGVRVWRVA